jgi:phosphotransferase system  glucose/maltose/N-acetylglucosamine-specific IIC component
MSIIPRILVAILALGALVVALTGWIQPASLSAQFQLLPTAPLGVAAVRADIGGLFLALAIFMGMAALKQSRTWAMGAMIIGVCALSGRLFGLIVDGAGSGTIPPMVVEIISLAILFWARTRWNANRSSSLG